MSTKRKIKLSKVSSFHYFRLTYRSILFIYTLIWYITSRMNGNNITIRNVEGNMLLNFIWLLFFVEMVMRFFPSNLESPGCQKQFKKNYHPTGRTDVVLHDNNAVMIAALAWISLNGIFGWMYMLRIIDEGILLLICLAYSICDMICILFFCPFQTWILKNRCCVSCRIYNWDYAMMFTPLFFIPSVYTWSLLVAAIILMIRWELTIWHYPERFSENTNDYLKCANCSEKLCTHKKQLISFKKGLAEYAEKQMQRILSGKE